MGLRFGLFSLGCGCVQTSLQKEEQMEKTKGLTEELNHDGLTDAIPYLLAGFEGRTSGNKVNSITVQQTGFSGYRVIIRGTGFDERGDTIYIVSFTIGNTPGQALLIAEGAYREDLIQWKVDQFAASSSNHGATKNEKRQLTLLD